MTIFFSPSIVIASSLLAVWCLLISVLDFSIVLHQIGKNLYLERCSILDWGCLGWRCLQNSDAHRWNGQESASWYTHVWKAARLLPRACRRLHAVSSTGQYWLVLASTGEVLGATGQYIISETLSQICCCVTIICMCVVLHCNCNQSNPDQRWANNSVFE